MFPAHSPLRRAVTTLSLLALGTTALIGLHSSAGASVAAPAHWMTVGSAASSPPARYDAAMVYDAATNTTLLFGGVNTTSLAETWAWNGAFWTQLSPPVSPPALRGAAMVYDEATHDVVLFGGLSATGALGGTWTWDGTTWTQQPVFGPAPRYGASMVYDEATHDVVLFGGHGASGPLADTWLWNGTAWTVPTLSEPSPAARFESSMAYDATTHDVVLYGGMGATGPIADTWTWDGANWTQEPAANPSARYGASMFYDPTSGGVVLFGGSDGTSSFSETWQWNGASWSTLLTSSAPSGRYLAAAAYDGATNSALLVGGTTGRGALSDTWNFVDLPSSPLMVRATSNNNTQSVVTWNVPASNGGTVIYGYRVTASDLTMASRGGQTCTTYGTTMVTITSNTPVPTTCTVTGLTNGDQYRFAASALSLVGTGAPSWSNVVRPATAPSAPVITGAVASAGAVVVSWSVPTNSGGTPVGSYRVTASPGAAFCHVPLQMLSCRIIGLQGGVTYTFTMTATNAAGTSVTSMPSSPVSLSPPVTPVTPVTTVTTFERHVTLPSAPFIVRKFVGGRFVTIRWVAPSSNGGVRLSGYDIYVGPSPNGAAYRPVVPVSFRQFAYTFALARGQTVFIIVRAVNVAGIGPFSNQVALTAR